MRSVRVSTVALLLAVVLITGILPLTFAEKAGRVLIGFEPGELQAVSQAVREAGGQIHYEFADLNALAVTLPSSGVDRMRRNPKVVSIEDDAKRYLAGYLDEQTIPYGIERVQAPDVWSAELEGDQITVCIIDSGLYTGHDDLAGVDVIGGYSTDPVGMPWNQDGCGHGTHVAGTIAASNNDIGVVGVSPGVSLYIVRVFGNDCLWAYASDLIDAAYRCADAGASIISMSLSGNSGPRIPEKEAFDLLYEQGILSVAAASNDGTRLKAYPASYDSVVSVAATDINNEVADFSNQNQWVELAAPGVNVLSTVPWYAGLTVDGVTYDANQIEYAATGEVEAALLDGGLCTTTGEWSGKVVLCERGENSFYEKVMNVQDSGGLAAVIYNNEPGNFAGTLGEGNTSAIPAISLSQEDGAYLVENKLDATGYVIVTEPSAGSGYEAWGGTSMATPHVSGVAALLWSSNPDGLTNVMIREAMAMTALDLGEPGRDIAYGYGLVQAYDALQYLVDMKPGKGPKQ
jgi:serine protease